LDAIRRQQSQGYDFLVHLPQYGALAVPLYSQNLPP
jgi:hypothetical protein